MIDPNQARSIFELMMLTAWADGHLEVSESVIAAAVLDELPELRALPGLADLGARARERLEEQGIPAALAEVAQGLHDTAHRELAFVCCARVLEADGIIAREEFQVLAELKALFDLGHADVARLLQKAART